MNSVDIALNPRYMQQIRTAISVAMTGINGTVQLFGSRARGNPRRDSDIDLAVAVPKNRAFAIVRLRELLEESTIPFTVDIVDLNRCDASLVQQIEREGIIIWKG